MNILAIAGGAAVLVIYLAGRRASKAIADEPPIFGDYADGATGTGGGGYYGGGGGGGDGGLSAGVGTLAPIAAGVQASNGTFGRSSDASKTLAETFAESLGYKQLEKDVAQVDLGSPSGSLERSAASVQMPVASSLQIAAATASATPYASSSLSMSSTPSTAGNASVTSAAVRAQPVRTTSAPVAAISARAVSPVVSTVSVSQRALSPAPVSTAYSFLNSIQRGPNGAVLR